ncbi:MAG: peptide-methionine (S)-S-oxide reductase MsrA [Beijerinckiaceae bacterium]|nr:peptide-methionine (S)-S-oxide reductase MsrA [Beijerinckiaceae bacterium]
MNTRAIIFSASLALSVGLPAALSGAAAQQATPRLATAIFAGGCFWCMEPPFDALDGVVSTTSGYTSGTRVNPTYAEVSAGGTGHTEAVKIVYNPSKVSYEKLLEVFWRNHDPLTANAQFCDKGSQYRAGIYYANETEKRLAESTKMAIEKSGRFKQPIVTEIVAATTFYPAEESHQNYYIKNPIRYKYYSTSCGRARRLNELWGG